MNKLLNYAGSKIKHVTKINELINQSDAKYYVEPFFGSGAVFFNLEKNFDTYFISDNNHHITSIYRAVRRFSYDDIINYYQNAVINFGDFKKDKAAYYRLRQFYNDTYFKTPQNDEGGVYMYFLVNACINSFARFGPNGFNASFGKRDFVGTSLTREMYEFCQERLKRTQMFCVDYRDVLSYKDHKDTLFFLDPPYFERPATYNTEFSKNKLNEFLESINDLKGDVLYTDTLHGHLDWDYVELRKISNSSPSVSDRTSNNKTEVLYHRIKKP